MLGLPDVDTPGERNVIETLAHNTDWRGLLLAPVDDARLAAAYRALNRDVFENYLPSVIDISFSGRLRANTGIAVHHTDTRDPALRYRISMARLLAEFPEELLASLLHQMIHIWQYRRYDLSGEREVLDRRGAHNHSPGHGKHFAKWVRTLGARGLTVAAEGTGIDAGPQAVELLKRPRYGVVLGFRSGRSRLIALPRPLEHVLELFCVSAEEHFRGVERLIRVRSVETQLPIVSRWRWATRNGCLPGNIRREADRASDIDAVLGNPGVRVGRVDVAVIRTGMNRLSLMPYAEAGEALREVAQREDDLSSAPGRLVVGPDQMSLPLL